MNPIKYIYDRRKTFAGSICRRMAWLFPNDAFYLRLLYFAEMGKFLHLKNPRTFNEKINWLKLHNRKPEYTQMVDKYAVKDYVAEKIGADYIIPTLNVWDRPEDIDWDTLPDQFVLKTTHGGGGCGVVVCTDKSRFNKEAAIEKLKWSMKKNAYPEYREWPYKNVKRKIIAEKFMASRKSTAPMDLDDYKFFCFDGEPLYCQVIRGRHTQETIDFYDMDWNHQEFVGLNPNCKNGAVPVPKPMHLEDMIRVCRELAKGIPFVRVDLYVIDDKEYFGELTFYPASGIGRFTPNDWENKLGELIVLPNQ